MTRFRETVSLDFGGDPMRRAANHHFDSNRWQDFRFRSNDIVIGSWAKSGTTWLQQLVCQLIFDGAEVNVSAISPWVDFRIVPLRQVVSALEAQRHRRVMKTHLPAEAMPIRDEISYLYIARPPPDVVWSWYRHHRQFTPEAYSRLNDAEGRVGPPLRPPAENFRDYLRRWLLEDGFPFHPYWTHILSWWNIRQRHNVKLVHFLDLKASLQTSILDVAAFLNIAPSPEAWPRIVEHCTFAYMKAHAALFAPLGGSIFMGGASAFFDSGGEGHWREQVKESDIEDCAAAARRHLPADCVEWLYRDRRDRRAR